MINSLQDTVELNNGIQMPGLGFGVYKMEEEDAAISVQTAIANGYRSIDTASFYDNETGVGQGIKQSGISREELFITTKVWNDEQGYENTLYAFERSLNKLGIDYLDLYLIHWPVKDMYIDTWKAMEELYELGKIRAIGVCNFHTHHLEHLMNNTRIQPVINQVEYHPHLTQEALRKYCEQQNIQLEAWSPLKKGQLLDNPVIQNLARKYHKTPAQIIIRWDLEHGAVTIPKSTHRERIQENADVFDFSLSEEDITEIDHLNRNERTGKNPDSFDE